MEAIAGQAQRPRAGKIDALSSQAHKPNTSLKVQAGIVSPLGLISKSSAITEKWEWFALSTMHNFHQQSLVATILGSRLPPCPHPPYMDTYSGEMDFLMACGCLPGFWGIVWATSPVDRILLLQTFLESCDPISAHLSSFILLKSDRPCCLLTTIIYWKMNQAMQQYAWTYVIDSEHVVHGRYNYSWKVALFGRKEKGKYSL